MPTGVDLRLVPAAAAGWLTCVVGVTLPLRVLLLACVVATCVAAVGAALLLPGHRRGRRGAGRRARPRRTGPGTHRCAPGRPGWTIWLAVVTVACCLSSVAAQAHLRGSGDLARSLEERAVVALVGRVASEPVPVVSPWQTEVEPSQYRVVLRVEHITVRGRAGRAAASVVVIGDPSWQAAERGAQVRVAGRLRGGEPGAPTLGVLSTTGPPEVLAAPEGSARWVAAAREALLEASDDLAPDARGLVPGTAIGDTRKVPEDLDAAMRTVSLTHVTAVSGAHFAIVSSTVLALLAVSGAPRSVRVVVAAVTMLGFVLLVHPQPSVMRAGLMGSLGLVGLLVGRPSRAAPALGAVVVVLVVLDPWLARSYGFILSVLATGAIVLLAPALVRALDAGRPRGMLLAVPLSAQAVCAPVLVLLEPVVGPYAVPANLLATPALVPATLLGVLATLVAPWAPSCGALLAQAAAVPASWIAWVARAAADLPGATIAWPSGPGGAVLLAVLTAGVLAAALRAARRRTMA
ncbi:ComEC/Rec2 family competence protein [Actinotalea sp. BY-33]|uniref:ComEC/Rec2 family competence protein n=1 Tax=Actinotalea soli TaxID=2819234 RepID=A0A939RT90_9CELL|nr:ComEC/Rec2 family competence protein [Actinotalea soli]MBO1750714.1 ComEC/Rec2 family competence protein [Actinotalea soli]